MKYRIYISIIIIICLFLCACGKDAELPNPENAVITQEADEDRVVLPSGRSFKSDAEHISIPGVNHEDIDALIEIISSMPDLNYVNLGRDADDGNSLTPEDIERLLEAFPDIDFIYTFVIGNREISLDDTYLDLNHVKMTDNGEKIRGIMKVLKNVSYLDLDFCGVPDDVMSQIRDENPETEVVWRVWFGKQYSVRTDAERIVASNPDVDCLTGKDTEVLKYCTKVRFIDLGHNEIDDISFVAYMLDLEVAILALNTWTDLSPIANCTKLNYLEMDDTNCKDLSALANLSNLQDLNICNLGEVSGCDSLLNLSKIDRLWIGTQTDIPDNIVSKLRAQNPDANINTTATNSVLSDWRWDPSGERVERYDELFRELGYYNYRSLISYYYNDPKYYPEGYTGPKVVNPEW